MRSVQTIIDNWKIQFGSKGRGETGPYDYIPFNRKKDLLYLLAEILKEEGYKREDFLDEDDKINATMQLKVVNACEAEEGSSKRKPCKIKQSKDITAKNWKWAVQSVFLNELTVPAPAKEVVDKDSAYSRQIKDPELSKSKPEKELEINPTDRIKIDTSDMAEAELDEEFLKELGIDESFVNGKTDE